ncbi:MAG TPA: hypothetical protein VF824_22255 [Thermoanaerobaculia bacterium]|jgi:hypothetical protein
MEQRSGSFTDVADCAIASRRAALRRFSASAPQLRELLQSSDGCEREMLLRAAMRDTLRELAEKSRRAALIEADPSRAEQLQAVSDVALELARTAAQ